MTVSKDKFYETYIAIAGQTAFPFDWMVLQDSDQTAYVNGAKKTFGVDFTVSGAGNPSGGTVTFVTGLSAGDIVLLRRSTPITQETDLDAGQRFYEAAIEAMADKLTLIAQEFPGLVIPLSPAGYYLRTKADGSGIEAVAALDTTVAMPFDTGTGPPTSGTWETGHIRFNSAPVAGEALAWECLVGGTPGTWHPCGIISANAAGASVPVLGDLIVKDSPWVDVRAFMDGQSGRPTLETWELDQENTDVTAVFSALIAYIVAAGTDCDVYLAAGTYKVLSSLSGVFAEGIRIRFFGPGVIDATGCTDPVFLTLGGSIGSSAALGAAASKGDLAITCSLAVSPGDIIRILSTDSFSPASANFVKGEMAEVLSVSGGVITLASQLFDSYLAATTTVYKVNAPRVIVENIKILRDLDDSIALRVQYTRKPEVRSVWVSGARDKGIELLECFGGVVDDVDARDAWYSGSGTSYGLLLNSCQFVNVSRSRLLSGRHGFSAGGTFPCRGNHIHHNVVDNKHGVALYSFDMHGNCELNQVKHNLILNGADIENADNVFDENIVLTIDYIYGLMFNLWKDGEALSARNNLVKNLKSDGSAVTITTSGTANITVDTIDLSGSILISPQNTLRVTTGSGAAVTFTIGLLKLNDLRVKATNYYSVYMAAEAPETLAADVDATGAVFIAARGPYFSFNGDFVFSGGKVSVTGAATYTFNRIGIGDTIVDNVIFDGGGVAPGVRFENTGLAKIANSLIKNMGSAPLSCISAVVILMDVNNLRNNNSGSDAIATDQYVTGAIGDALVTKGTAAPAAGTWAAGSRCYNSEPAGGQPKSWVCTVAGTPGTWVSEGNL